MAKHRVEATIKDGKVCIPPGHSAYVFHGKVYLNKWKHSPGSKCGPGAAKKSSTKKSSTKKHAKKHAHTKKHAKRTAKKCGPKATHKVKGGLHVKTCDGRSYTMKHLKPWQVAGSKAAKAHMAGLRRKAGKRSTKKTAKKSGSKKSSKKSRPHTSEAMLKKLMKVDRMVEHTTHRSPAHSHLKGRGAPGRRGKGLSAVEERALKNHDAYVRQQKELLSKTHKHGKKK